MRIILMASQACYAVSFTAIVDSMSDVTALRIAASAILSSRKLAFPGSMASHNPCACRLTLITRTLSA